MKNDAKIFKDEIHKQMDDLKKQNDELMIKMNNNETSMTNLIQEVKAMMKKSQ